MSLREFISSRLSSAQPVDVNEPIDGVKKRTRLHLAVQENHLGVAKGLLRIPALDPNLLDVDKFSALLYAIRDDRPEMSKLLLRHARVVQSTPADTDCQMHLVTGGVDDMEIDVDSTVHSSANATTNSSATKAGTTSPSLEHFKTPLRDVEIGHQYE